MIRDVFPADESVVDAVLFDWGGVLTDLPSIIVPKVMEQYGVRRIPPEERTDDALERFQQLERGEISLDRYLAAARVANPGSERLWDPSDEAFVYPRLLPRPAVVDAVIRIRAAGYRTALLSNNVAEYWDLVLDTLDVDAMFDVVVNSAHVGARKPEARIYQHALTELDVQPGRALFLDDNADNIDGAAAVGLLTIQVNERDHELFDKIHLALSAPGSTVS